MKKRRNTILTRIMIMALIVTNSAGSMPVFAAPENGFEEDFGFKDKFEEEFEAEAEEEVEAEDTTDADDEFVEETEDVEVVTISRGECGFNSSENEKITWELDSDGVLLIHATGTDQYMKDYSETNPAPWYDLREDIKAVEVSGDIRNIGEYAFNHCEALKTVELSYTIRVIDDYAFADCTGLEKVTYDEPAKVCVERYGFASFINCTSLKQMDISQRVDYIDDFTFYNCVKFVPSNMETLPNTLTYIGEGAFWNCKSITKVVIPYSVTYIGGGYSGKNYTATWSDKTYTSSDAATIVDGIKDKWGAFAGCTGLTSVRFVNYLIEDEFAPDGVRLAGVRHIDDFAFYGCTSLGSVTLPATLGYLGDYAFANCTGMTDAVIEDSELERLYGTFEECTSLTEVVFGTYETREYDKGDGLKEYTGYWSGIREIGKRTFNACSSLTDVVLTPELFNWRYELGIHKQLNDTADDMTVIGEDAFRSCSKLAHFDFPTDTLKIGSSAFRDDVQLNHVVLAETTTELGANAFYNDTAMEDFYIPAAMQTIGGDCFYARQGIQAMRLMDLYYGGDDFDFMMINIANFGNDLITSGSNAMYKATRYYQTNPTYPVSTSVDVIYEKSTETSGIMQISWEPVTRTIVDKNGVERTVNPTKYYVYQNNIGSNTVDDQWKTVTPSWTWIGSPTTNSLPRIVDNVKPGDIYNYRVIACFGDSQGYLSPYVEYMVPEAEEDIVITSIATDKEEYSVAVDSSVTVNVSITPDDAEVSTLTWVSANPAIATVSIDSENPCIGYINGIKTGETTITVSSGDVEITFKVTVVKSAGAEMRKEESGKTVYYQDGEAQTEYTGLVCVDDEWYYVQKGVLAEDKCGFVDYEGGKFLVIDGMLDKTANGVVQDPDHPEDWYFCASGQVQTQLTGYLEYDGELYYVKNGKTPNGLVEYDGGLFYWVAGQIQTQLTGLVEYDGEWYYVKNGQVDTMANGLVEYDGGLFYFVAGQMQTQLTGLVEYDGEWYYVKNGQVDTTANGPVEWNGEWYYVKNGKLDTTVVAYIVTDQDAYSVEVGDKTTVQLTVNPSDANTSTIKWVSADPTIASVSADPEDDLQGFITGVAPGKTTITVSAGDVKTTFKVTVSEIYVESIALSSELLKINPGAIGELSISITPENISPTTFTWESSNNQVATVTMSDDEKSAIITGVKEGTATITVTSKNGKTASCEVKVENDEPDVKNVTGVTLDKTSLTLEINETEMLTATVDPTDADNTAVTWSSSDEDVATVDEDGMVTAVAEGTATITVTTEDGGYTAVCEVNVKLPEEEVIAVTGVALNMETLELTEGETGTLEATVSPEDATNKTVFWSSGDETVATVDENGAVKAVKAGTAIITIKTEDGEFSAVCEVTVAAKPAPKPTGTEMKKRG